MPARPCRRHSSLSPSRCRDADGYRFIVLIALTIAGDILSLLRAGVNIVTVLSTGLGVLFLIILNSSATKEYCTH